jgi:glucose-6-phosphate isomerase
MYMYILYHNNIYVYLGKTIAELQAEGVPANLHAHKEFPGNRPSLSLLFPSLTPYTCGQLLALYEHRVAVQGFVWGINSFDQVSFISMFISYCTLALI